jgi:hypothetical protein
VLAIYAPGVPPRFRMTGIDVDAIRAETLRAGGNGQLSHFALTPAGLSLAGTSGRADHRVGSAPGEVGAIYRPAASTA